MFGVALMEPNYTRAITVVNLFKAVSTLEYTFYDILTKIFCYVLPYYCSELLVYDLLVEPSGPILVISEQEHLEGIVFHVRLSNHLILNRVFLWTSSLYLWQNIKILNILYVFACCILVYNSDISGVVKGTDILIYLILSLAHFGCASAYLC